MKHLFTKLLLVMCMLFGPAVAARSFHCNIIGNANFMDTKTPQSSGEEGSWKLPGAYQLCDATGDLYFWATGKFKLSQVKKDETNMDTWTSSAFKIDSSNITWNSKSASDLGATSDSPKFVHLAIRPNGGNFVEVKDAPFAGYEGVWSDYVAPLPSLYIGGSWGGSENWWTPVKIEATETSYKDYVVTTTKNNAEFRFYSIDNPTSSDSDKSKWFGASGENNMTVSTDGTNYTANSSALKTFVISEPGTYTIKVSEFSGSSVKFSVVKSSSAYNNSLYVGIASSNRHQIQPAAGGGVCRV